MSHKPNGIVAAVSMEVPSSSLARGVATVLAVPVYVISVGIASLGVVVLVAGVKPGATLIAILCLGVAWESRPRLGRVPRDVVPRQRLEELYGLTDEISAVLGTQRVAGLVLSPWFGASTGRVGIRRRAYVAVGVPLFAVLKPQERVAVIGHEIAHLANRDPRRTTVLGTALRTLETWERVLDPSFGGLVGLLWTVLSIVPLVFVLGYQGLLRRLVLRESRRSELVADLLSAEVGGSQASASALRKLGLEAELHSAAMGASLDGDPAAFFDGFRGRAASVVAAGAVPEPDPFVVVDATHPPTALRIAVLEREHRHARVVLSPSDSEAIDRSLKPFEEQLAADIIDTYRDRLSMSSPPRWGR